MQEMSNPSKDSMKPDDDQTIELFKQTMAPGATEFALSMAKLLYKQDEQNVIFSPINLYSALALVLLGADGETFHEIATLMGVTLSDRKNDQETNKLHEKLSKALQAIENTTEVSISSYTDSDDDEPSNKSVKATINITSGIFVQDGFNLIPSYVSRARSYYKSEVSNLDFYNDAVKATDVINEFVAKNTQQRIPKSFEEPVDRETRICLASCVYFKATWSKQFDKEDTRDENFNTGSKNVLVKMMRTVEEHWMRYIDLPDLYLEAVHLNYEGKDACMVVVLPKVGKSLNEVLSSLRVEHLRKIAEKSTMEEVDLKLPRMKFKSTSDIDNYLKQLGMKRAFSDQSELTNMIDGLFFISKVTHAAEIEVDENGTEASATTAMMFVSECAGEPNPRVKKFHVNRPFLFYIYHRKTHTILFMGTVHNPQTL